MAMMTPSSSLIRLNPSKFRGKNHLKVHLDALIVISYGRIGRLILEDTLVFSTNTGAARRLRIIVPFLRL